MSLLATFWIAQIGSVAYMAKAENDSNPWLRRLDYTASAVAQIVAIVFLVRSLLEL